MQIRLQLLAWLSLLSFGIAALNLMKDDAEKGQRILTAIQTLQSWVMKLVRLVTRLHHMVFLPLMTKVVASSNVADILNLGGF